MAKLKEKIVEMIYGALPYSTTDSIRANVDDILSLIAEKDAGAEVACSDLLPCPCCGGKAEFDYDDNGYNWIYCTKCGLSTDTEMHCEDDAKDRLRPLWNRRAG